MKQNITARASPNKNIFVAAYRRRMMRDGAASHPFLESEDMKQIITAKLKLTTTPEQFQALRTTQLAYRDALYAVSHYTFQHGKTSRNTTLHKGMYAELRTRYHLPSQLACSVERQVTATRHRTVDQALEEYRASKSQDHEEALQGTGSTATLQFPNRAVYL